MTDKNTPLEDCKKKFAKIVKEEIASDVQVSPPDDIANEGEAQLVLFRGKEIRQVFHDNEWFFSIIDAISAISESDNPRRYWSDLKRKLAEDEGFDELYENIVQLKMPSEDGKMRGTDAVNTETLFRIIQSIPSKKAEPFKKWLAKVGYERIQEFQDPEIAIKRALLNYKAKGYSDEWVNARIQSIVSRKEVTNEWQKRGIADGLQYALLTDAISLGAFGLKTKAHRGIKNLKKSHNLRDHMSPLELALTMLGETTTAEIARSTDAQGFKDNKDAAKAGGDIAGNARKNIERKLNKKVVTSDNFLREKEDQRSLPE